jgi:hypothetical protein
MLVGSVQRQQLYCYRAQGTSPTATMLPLQGSKRPPPRRPRCYLYRAQGTSLPATLAPSYTPLYSWASPYVYKRGCPGPCGRRERKEGEKRTNIRAYEHTNARQGRRVDARQRDGRRRAGAEPPPPPLSLFLSPTRSLSPSLSRNACNPYYEQDNTRLIPPLVFDLAPTHLGRGTQRQIYSSVQGPPGPKPRQLGTINRINKTSISHLFPVQLGVVLV